MRDSAFSATIRTAPPTAAWIAERARQLGFASCGIVRAEKFPELARHEEWLSRGYAGEMHYLSDARRLDPRLAMPGVRSVIVCALTYNTAHPRTAQAFANQKTPESSPEGARGWISRYAWGDDYHEVLRGKLHALLQELRNECADPFEARVYSDTGPVNERVLARHAGFGWLGKNTLLLNEQLGSFFFLGTILTTLELEPAPASGEFPPPDRCGTCRRCIDACPTGALVEAYVMDARKCVSYLTIELRSPIPEDLREAMGRHVFGCDICQDVCPWNRDAPVTHAREFEPRAYQQNQKHTEVSCLESSGECRESLFMPRLEWLASMNESEFREIFRGSAVKRTKWKGLLRNACIALGNAHVDADATTRPQALRLLTRLAACSEPAVAESAQWAISRIQGNDAESDIRC